MKALKSDFTTKECNEISTTRMSFFSEFFTVSPAVSFISQEILVHQLSKLAAETT